MKHKNANTWSDLKASFVSFILGEYFKDAVRNTLTIVTPIIIFFGINLPSAAIGIGIGALLISLTDLPGNKSDKYKTGLFSIIVFFITSVAVSFNLYHGWVTACVLFLLTFVYSMLSLFGSRAGLTGTMAIILGIFVLGLRPDDPLIFSVFILIGGSWYYLISFLLVNIWPYSSLHHAIFECISGTRALLAVKANCYDPSVSIDTCYEDSIRLHILVSEKQDLVRNLLLNDSRAMKPKNRQGQKFLRITQGVISLYEQVTAIHFDYEFIRNTLQPSGALPYVNSIILLLTKELEELSQIFLQPIKRNKKMTRTPEFERIKTDLLTIAKKESEMTSHIIERILQNINEIQMQINNIRSAGTFGQNGDHQHLLPVIYKVFLPERTFSWASLKSELSIKSPKFRFSLKLAFLIISAYLLSCFLPSSEYSYWMLLTIVIVAKPSYAITIKRNKERILGTFLGGVIGFSLLFVISEARILLLFAGIFLAGFFTFNRTRYSVSVVCITCSVLLCLSLYHGHTNQILTERIFYTIAGCIISIGGAYILPIWEITQIRDLVNAVLEGNRNYLEEVINFKCGQVDEITVSLSRKNSHLKLAKVSETLQNIIQEPNKSIVDLVKIREVQAINYRINAVITSIFVTDNLSMTSNNNMNLFTCILNNLNFCQMPVATEITQEKDICFNSGEHTLYHLYSLSKVLRGYH